MLAPTTAHAYIDPGSAGFLITTCLGAVAAAGYMVRSWLSTSWRWLRGLGRGGSGVVQADDDRHEEARPEEATVDQENRDPHRS